MKKSSDKVLRVLAAGDFHGDSDVAKKLAIKAEKENVDLTKFLKLRMEVLAFPVNNLIYLIDGNPFFIKSERVFPTLVNDYVLDQLPTLTVDMGAIPYICNGADVMAPGIVKVDGQFNADALVVIIDEKFSKKLPSVVFYTIH